MVTQKIRKSVGDAMYEFGNLQVETSLTSSATVERVLHPRGTTGLQLKSHRRTRESVRSEIRHLTCNSLPLLLPPAIIKINPFSTTIILSPFMFFHLGLANAIE